jgi:hypothetical protein
MVNNKNWNHVALLAQLKSGLPRISYKDKRVPFNAMNIYFGQPSKNNNDKCNLCSLLLPETLFHVPFECPAYVLIRQKEHLDCYPKTSQEAMEWTKQITHVELRSIVLYFDKVLRYLLRYIK